MSNLSTKSLLAIDISSMISTLLCLIRLTALLFSDTLSSSSIPCSSANPIPDHECKVTPPIFSAATPVVAVFA